MAARSVNSAIAKEISQEVDKFYEKLELRYYSSIPRDDVTQKLALQDLFHIRGHQFKGKFYLLAFYGKCLLFQNTDL